VYFIQAPVIVLVAVSLKGLVLLPLAKTALVAFITVPLCFAVAWLVLKIRTRTGCSDTFFFRCLRYTLPVRQQCPFTPSSMMVSAVYEHHPR
jgi:hypothetical protein